MVKSADGVGSSSSPSVAPFLRKCYEMVDDSSTDSIISWSTSADNTFVILDTTVFSVQLLPKYFKHSNFSSFIRQLNIYGFRKVDADRWEFANEGFVRGQKDLLKNVIRRKNVQSSDQNKTVHIQETSTKPENENSELWREVDVLKGDKNALAQELMKVSQYQEITDTKMLNLKDRVQGMEESQQEMLSFLVMVIQNPDLLVQLLQPKEKNWRMAAEGGGKGATILEEVTDEGETNSNSTTTRQLPLVTYQQPALEGTTGKTSLNDVNDFLRNADMMKFCMDENHVPLIIPDLYDDGAWEKLLLLSPSKKKKKNVKKGKDDGDDEAKTLLEEEDGRMESENNKSRMLELIQEEMEKLDFEFGQLSPERSKNLEILTKQMGFLASNE